MAATIYKIAERAGVSSSTVARVLRGDLKESWKGASERAAKIRRIAEEMGYQPNLRARAFSRGKTHSIGLLYTNDAWIFEGVNSQVVNSFIRELRTQGYHLVFVPLENDGQWQEIVRGGQVDGCIMLQCAPEKVRQVLEETAFGFDNGGDGLISDFDLFELQIQSLVESDDRLNIEIESIKVIEFLAGDFNNDGQVDGDDLTGPNGWEARFGIGLNGGDFLTWQRNFGAGTTALSASNVAVPEPSSIALLGMVLGAIFASASRGKRG